MCASLDASSIASSLAVAGITAAMMAQNKQNFSGSITPQQIEVTTPQTSAPTATQGPEAPTATPVMQTQGQGSAEDEQKNATDKRVRKNRQGRSMLRIDRTLPANGGLAGGSGVNVPSG